jgi:hypothetical protein
MEIIMRLRLFYLTVLFACLFPIVALSQSLEYAGSTFWSGMNGVAVNGNYAYCIFPSGLITLDVSDFSLPVEISKLKLTGYVTNIELQDDALFLISDRSRLVIVNISNPVQPEIISSTIIGSNITDLSISGSYAYCVQWDSLQQLLIFDISNIANPVFTGSIDIPGAYAVSAAADIACVTSDTGFAIVDVSIPTNPTLVVNYDLNVNDPAEDLAIHSSNAYVCTRSRFYIVDISNPEVPTTIGSCGVNLSAERLVVANDRAYLSSIYGLELINLSDLLHPFSQGRYNRGVNYTFVQNYSAFLASPYGLFILDVEDSAHPEVIACYYANTDAVPHTSSNNLLYLLSNSNDTSGIQHSSFVIMEFDDSLNPRILSSYPVQPYASDITSNGQYAYIADNDSGLLVLNISDINNPLFCSRYPGQVLDLQLAENRVFITSGNSIKILDITAPENPTLLGEYYCADNFLPTKIQISENYIYALCAFSYEFGAEYNIKTINMAYPSCPYLENVYYPQAEISGFELADDILYLSTICRGFPGGEVWLKAYDISTPPSLLLTDQMSFLGHFSEIEIFENYLIFNTGILYVVDKSNPSDLRVVSTCPSDGTGIMEFQGNYLCVGGQNALGIYRFSPSAVSDDLKTPENIALPQNYPNPFNAQTTIQYSLKSPANVSIDILDILGRRIKTITPGMQPAGTHRVIWDGSNYSSGIYFYRVNSGAFSETSRMTLLK